MPRVLAPSHPSLQDSLVCRPDRALTRKERALLGLTALIRNTQNWRSRIRNTAAVAQWKHDFRAAAARAAGPTVPYDAAVWAHRLRTYDNPKRPVRPDANARGGRMNAEPPYVRRLLELEFGERLAPPDQRRVEALVEQMWDDESIAPQLYMGTWVGAGIVLETPLELVNTFWSDELFDFAIAESVRELADCQRNFSSAPSQVVPAAVRMACQADDYMALDELAALNQLATELENVPEHRKDWRAGTRRQVLDLVCPSLFCYVHGITPCLAECKESRSPADWLAASGSGEVPSIDPRRHYAMEWNFQDGFKSDFKGRGLPTNDYMWLPTDFEVDPTGKVHLLSYINNLHPITQAKSYQTLARVLEKFIPLFERVASDYLSPAFKKPRLLDPKLIYNRSFERRPGAGPSAIDQDEPTMFDPAQMHPALPPLGDSRPCREVVINMKGSVLQVVVKLSNVYLTPDNPSYDGESWQTEATLFEGVFATGICHYDQANITTPQLDFRHDTFPADFDYPQYAGNAVREVYGLVNGGDCTQHVGTIDAVQGRCIAYPNNYQHRVGPFTLQDTSKPGHLKTLSFCLIDPAGHRVSTGRMPPQRADWFAAQLRGSDDSGGTPRCGLGTLPDEILQQIAEDAGLMTFAQASAHRAALRKERADTLLSNDEMYFTHMMRIA
ncbi:hypothetical protein HDU89_005735 [Geranomyces variabilis]|nr:hypothetical protein HDU89_005735 [Geranomyces variabilis]